ncbi:hypothetical protein Phum_PHUM375900 [Pediculus humanus corporis]|uniref:Uncharacterized protein n=1 Tax=Pediculus humanus subsp. corporis TaxID=121224 RepID=E0VQB7_PEDHC|nr:uncharacterized protein Phum_PHUM375900 [Pediculus humanus corporis]EEB15573.1 hypothetical protein Phum_PHUM375900 [Pediculus humanus corporis]
MMKISKGYQSFCNVLALGTPYRTKQSLVELEQSLNEFANVLDANEVLLFEKDIFLVFSQLAVTLIKNARKYFEKLERVAQIQSALTR